MSKVRFPLIFSKVFNISRYELPRIIPMWALRFCYFFAFFMGWTLLIALFVSDFSAYHLPWLYISYALASMLGSFGYSLFVYRLSQKTILLLSVIPLLACLISAIVLQEGIPFFTMLIAAIGIFLPQVDILLARYAEETFTPLESQRALPLIDTTEPIGGIAAGAVLSLLIGHMHSQSFLYFLVGAFFILLCIFLLLHKKATRAAGGIEKNKEGKIVSLARGLEHIQALPFMRGLLLVVLLWMVALNIMDIQYTGAIAELTHHAGEEAASSTGALQDVLVERLGSFQILFSTLLLLMQLFFTSRILKQLGIVRSFLVLPAVALFSAFGGGLMPGLFFAVAGKATMDTLGGLQKIAYHNAYYCIIEHMREYVREFFEGVIRPFGLILSTILIFGIQYVFGTQYSTPLYFFLGLIFLTMILVALKLRGSYTSLAKKNLEMSNDYALKINAIEILAQKGHKDAAEILSKDLHYHRETPAIQKKILEGLGQLQDPLSLPEILAAIESGPLSVKIAACEALAQFKALERHVYQRSFTKHRIITILSDIFTAEHSKRLRSAIIKVFARIQHQDVVPFLLSILKDTKNEDVVADCIYVIGLFQDINSWHYLSPYLQSPSPRIKANTIIALWQFSKYRLQLLIYLLSLLESSERSQVLSGLYALGEIRAIQEQPRLERYLNSSDIELVYFAAIALLKMNNAEAVPILARLLLEEKPELAYKVLTLLRGVHSKQGEILTKVVKIEASGALHNLASLHPEIQEHLHEADKDILHEMLRLYTLLQDEQNIFKVRTLLEKRGEHVPVN